MTLRMFWRGLREPCSSTKRGKWSTKTLCRDSNLKFKTLNIDLEIMNNNDIKYYLITSCWLHSSLPSLFQSLGLSLLLCHLIITGLPNLTPHSGYQWLCHYPHHEKSPRSHYRDAGLCQSSVTQVTPQHHQQCWALLSPSTWSQSTNNEKMIYRANYPRSAALFDKPHCDAFALQFLCVEVFNRPSQIGFRIPYASVWQEKAQAFTVSHWSYYIPSVHGLNM